MPPDKPDPPQRPDYKVYRSRPRLLDRLRAPDLSSLRGRAQGKGPERPPRRGAATAPGERSLRRRVLRWALIAGAVWIAISLLAFAISSQLQKWKLDGGVGDVLGGNPLMAVFPQTILVIGTDVRSGAFASDAEAVSKHCIEKATSGGPTAGGCPASRADTIMLIRAGGGKFHKLSIPRDTFAAVPGQGSQKINGAYAFGGARLEIETVEQFLGIDIDHVAIVDFDGFRRFIDTIGGVEVDLPTDVCSSVSGGAFKLDLRKGERTLDGFQAITLARTRSSADCDGDGVPDQNFDDLSRTRFQQLILDGIKGRLTSPLRLPYNFIKGPLISWNAPKAMVGDMGALTMPQLLFSAVIGGGGGTEVLKPSGPGPGGSLLVPLEECQRAVRKLLGEDPPGSPTCSPQ
jgi:LCP family protein required for cell wall assembly